MDRELYIICGVRPQYVKAAALLWELQRRNLCSAVLPVVVNTGQHYDPNLSGDIISNLGIKVDEEIRHAKGDTPVRILASTMIALEEIILRRHASRASFIVFGDANPALAGAVVGLKMGIPVIHVEAGARRDEREQEHHNSRLVDAISAARFCLTERAQACLQQEGLSNNTYMTGDIACEWYFHVFGMSTKSNPSEENRCLVTLHRPSNMRQEVFSTLREVLVAEGIKAEWLTHPRNAKYLTQAQVEDNVLAPQTFTGILDAMRRATFVITDSGGLAREAHYLKKPVLMRRDIGGWPELREIGVLRQMPIEREAIVDGLRWAKALSRTYPECTPFIKPGGVDQAMNVIIGSLSI